MPAVTALVRGLEVLRCFDYARKSLGSSEIARLTGLPQPTVWRLCKTLEQEGYLVAEAGGTRFAPGLAVLTLGYAALGRLDLAELARPRLQAIADRFHGATGITTRERLSTLIVMRCEGKDAFLNVNLRPGSGGWPLVRPPRGARRHKPSCRPPRAVLPWCVVARPKSCGHSSRWPRCSATSRTCGPTRRAERRRRCSSTVTTRSRRTSPRR